MSFSDLTLKQLKQCLQKYRHMHTVKGYWKMAKSDLIDHLSRIFEIRNGSLFSLLTVQIPEVQDKQVRKKRENLTEESISGIPVRKQDIQKIMRFAKKVKNQDVMLTLCQRLNEMKNKVEKKIFSEGQRKVKSDKNEIGLLTELEKNIPKLWDLYNNLLEVE